MCALHFRATITVKQYCFYHVGETVPCKFLKGEKYCAGVLLELKSVSLVVSLCAPAGLHRVTAFQPGTKPVEGNLRWLFPLETRPGLWHAHTHTHTHRYLLRTHAAHHIHLRETRRELKKTHYAEYYASAQYFGRRARICDRNIHSSF